MNTKTIIEALELAAELIPYSKEDPTEPSQSGREFMSSDKWIASVNDVANKVQQALTLLRSPSEQGEGPYKKVECGSNRPGSVKFYRIKGPDDEMDYALHGNDVDYHLKRLNAAYRAGCISAGLQQGEPKAWYIERVVPGKRDNGVLMGPFWDKDEADELADEFHFVRALYAHPPQVGPEEEKGGEGVSYSGPGYAQLPAVGPADPSSTVAPIPDATLARDQN